MLDAEGCIPAFIKNGDYEFEFTNGVITENGFETVSSTEWNFGNKESGFYPQKYVDITDTFDAKCEAMQEYKSELCIFSHQKQERKAHYKNLSLNHYHRRFEFTEFSSQSQ